MSRIGPIRDAMRHGLYTTPSREPSLTAPVPTCEHRAHPARNAPMTTTLRLRPYYPWTVVLCAAFLAACGGGYGGGGGGGGGGGRRAAAPPPGTLPNTARPGRRPLLPTP